MVGYLLIPMINAQKLPSIKSSLSAVAADGAADLASGVLMVTPRDLTAFGSEAAWGVAKRNASAITPANRHPKLRPVPKASSL